MKIKDAIALIEAEIEGTEEEHDYYTITVDYRHYSHSKPVVVFGVYSSTRDHHPAKTLAEAIGKWQAAKPDPIDEMQMAVDEMPELV